MDGGGIDGFTDFRVHGAVFVNRRRFATGRPIPAEIRVAEALVHEGTHTRCNAAALGRPFLLPAGTDDDLLVLTPLRPDLRPLNGLFQQVVVLARCLSLYDRLAGAGNGGEAVAARRDKLLAQSRQGLGTIGAHRARLAPHGLEVLGEAEAVMARIPAAAG